jgi:DNA-binding NarL/FixJ family response regulator
MAEKLTLLHIDAATGIETIRELTSDERTDLAAINANSQQRKQEAEAKAAARESALAKLAALGLTEAEIAAL